MVKIIETYMQDSHVKGLRMVDFEVVGEYRIWLTETGERSFWYGQQMLFDSEWVLMDTRTED